MKVGIDTLHFYTSRYALDFHEFAKGTGQEVEKFHVGLGQFKMGISPPDEDAITLGANAAARLLERNPDQEIHTLIYATETGNDFSKAGGIYIHRLLGLSSTCAVLEVKQACYGSTAALHLAAGLVTRNPSGKVLVIASDISKYGFGTPGESSQGCGAVAMLVSQNPRLLVLGAARGVHTEDTMDFWRPHYSPIPFVDGKFSASKYLHGLEHSWCHYQKASGLSFGDHAQYCYHVPVPRLVEKAHRRLAKLNGISLSEEEIQAQLASALRYNRELGNCYTASLYVSFLSLLDQKEKDLSGARIGFYSYGSGLVAEYFSGIVQGGYRDVLDTARHETLLSIREEISYSQYQKWYDFQLPEDGSYKETPHHKTGKFRLAGIKNHQRLYERAA